MAVIVNVGVRVHVARLDPLTVLLRLRAALHGAGDLRGGGLGIGRVIVMLMIVRVIVRVTGAVGVHVNTRMSVGIALAVVAGMRVRVCGVGVSVRRMHQIPRLRPALDVLVVLIGLVIAVNVIGLLDPVAARPLPRSHAAKGIA